MPTAPPFRYDMANPRLVRYLGWPEPLETPRGFREDLLEHAGQIVRLAGDVDLVFVGRSPESLYDLLVGLLGETSWRERVQLLHLSLCDRTPGRLRRHEPGALAQLWRHVESLRLTPPQILARDRPGAFVDLVESDPVALIGSYEGENLYFCSVAIHRFASIRSETAPRRRIAG